MDGTGISWFLANTPVASVLFLLIIAVAGLFALAIRHERKCEALREKEIDEGAAFRREVRREFKEIRDLQADLRTSLARIEGCIQRDLEIHPPARPGRSQATKSAA